MCVLTFPDASIVSFSATISSQYFSTIDSGFWLKLGLPWYCCSPLPSWYTGNHFIDMRPSKNLTDVGDRLCDHFKYFCHQHRCNETHQWSQLQPYWNCYWFQVKCTRHALTFGRVYNAFSWWPKVWLIKMTHENPSWYKNLHAYRYDSTWVAFFQFENFHCMCNTEIFIYDFVLHN